MKLTWVEIDEIEKNKMDEYLKEYQCLKKISLMSYKTKQNKESKDFIYQCQEKSCPFRLKLAELQKKVKVYSSEQHNHNKDYVSISKLTFHHFKILFRHDGKKWNSSKN